MSRWFSAQPASMTVRHKPAADVLALTAPNKPQIPTDLVTRSVSYACTRGARGGHASTGACATTIAGALLTFSR